MTIAAAKLARTSGRRRFPAIGVGFKEGVGSASTDGASTRGDAGTRAGSATLR